MKNQYLDLAKSQLFQLATLTNFESIFTTAFGTNIDPTKIRQLRKQWLMGNFSVIPQIEVLTHGELGGASGGYAASEDKIFISSDFLAQHQGNPQAIAGLLLEEIGHKLDRVFNGNIDSPGDEGEIFSRLVRGENLSASTLARLKAEDDRAVITVGGKAVSIEQQTINGTANNDTLIGTADNDVISGGNGDDTLQGGNGDDTLNGEFGNDIIYGESGNDTLNGGKGNDSLYGGIGDDSLNGGSGNDTLYGGIDNDSLYGESGNDLLQGESGNDTLNGGDGNNTLDGGSGNDTLYGESVNDTLYGGSGNDTLYGGGTLYGGIGNDFISGWGNATLNGGSGNDTLSGGKGSDTLDGGVGNDYLEGGPGEDRFSFTTEASTGKDIITDFFPTTFGSDPFYYSLVGGDKIVLSQNVFASVTSANGWISNFATVANDAAALAGTSSAAILYSTSTGNLFYNQNGTLAGLGNSGGNFAQLPNLPNLTASNFIIE
jgi:Ca2+-binding RTX toxin-like protein